MLSLLNKSDELEFPNSVVALAVTAVHCYSVLLIDLVPFFVIRYVQTMQQCSAQAMGDWRFHHQKVQRQVF
jgi:hypothetical protein